MSNTKQKLWLELPREIEIWNDGFECGKKVQAAEIETLRAELTKTTEALIYQNQQTVKSASNYDRLCLKLQASESKRQKLREALNVKLIDEIANRGVLYGGDGFGLSIAQKQMSD